MLTFKYYFKKHRFKYTNFIKDNFINKNNILITCFKFIVLIISKNDFTQ